VKFYDEGGGGGAAKDLIDAFLMHQIYLSRFSAYEARKLIGILDNANSLVKQRILKAKSIDTKKHYERIASEIRRIMNEAVETLDKQLELDFVDLADEEIQFVDKTLSKLTVATEFDLPHPKQVWAAASFGPYAGPDGKYTFRKYMKSLGDNAFNIWVIKVRAGYLAGLSAKDVVREVLGKINTDGMEAGQVQTLRNSLMMNSRTMVASLAATARNAVYRENESIFSGFQWLSTLDLRSCAVCASRDLKIYKRLEDVPPIPAHHNCRCVTIPYIKGFEDIEGERASFEGPVSDKMSYKDWFDTLEPEQKIDILGPGRYKLYQQGMKIASFVQDGKTLTLEQLRKREGLG
jgi:hypothetical protein